MGYNSNIFLLMPKFDIDALAFFSAASITNYNQQMAINNLVVNLKYYGLWTRIHALWIFVGGNATSHMYNIKSPLNTDAAFRLTFAGTVTHNSDGVTFGSNGWANTHYIPNTNATTNNISHFAYSRTAAATATPNEADMGAAVNTTQRDLLSIRTSGDLFSVSINSVTAGAGNISGGTNTDGRGFYVGTRTSSTNGRCYKNGSQVGSTSTTTNDGLKTNLKIYLGCRNVANVASNFSIRNFALMGIGLGLDATQNANLYTVVQNYQTLLGRQV